jgi:hypothetical protein
VPGDGLRVSRHSITTTRLISGGCASACIAKIRPDSCTHQSSGVMSRVDHAADANMTA